MKATYSTREVSNELNTSPSRLLYLIRSGKVTRPCETETGRYRWGKREINQARRILSAA